MSSSPNSSPAPGATRWVSAAIALQCVMRAPIAATPANASSAHPAVVVTSADRRTTSGSEVTSARPTSLNATAPAPSPTSPTSPVATTAATSETVAPAIAANCATSSPRTEYVAAPTTTTTTRSSVVRGAAIRTAHRDASTRSAISTIRTSIGSKVTAGPGFPAITVSMGAWCPASQIAPPAWNGVAIPSSPRPVMAHAIVTSTETPTRPTTAAHAAAITAAIGRVPSRSGRPPGARPVAEPDAGRSSMDVTPRCSHPLGVWSPSDTGDPRPGEQIVRSGREIRPCREASAFGQRCAAYRRIPK